MSEDEDLLDEILSESEDEGSEETKVEEEEEAVEAEVVEDIEETEGTSTGKTSIGGGLAMLPEIFRAIADIPKEGTQRRENRLEPHAHLMLLFITVVILGSIIAALGTMFDF